MRYRQIHLDFHTSEHIPEVGAAFRADEFQASLRLGHVDSITVFAKCHHGWHYHPTTVGRPHPHLGCDLLGAQIAAAHAIGVKTPVYVSAGLDEQTYWREPGWARRSAEGSVPWAGGNDKAGFHELCLNTAYLDLLVAEVDEVVRCYDADGIFLDIVSPRPCWCCRCVRTRIDQGLDPRDPAGLAAQARATYLQYTRSIRAAVDAVRPGLPVFHNGGHIRRGDRELAHENTHIELESLPTGGWSYDHFPLSAGYARVLGLPFLGMTGRFHESWGEFGGYKHPNALRYEAALGLAHGARLSVGDQLHPSGRMDDATYALVGAAYAEVAAREAWVHNARSLAEVAVFSAEVQTEGKEAVASDEGAARVLNEGHIPFDVVDAEADLSHYRLLVLPDRIRLDDSLLDRLRAFRAGGGKFFATGVSGFAPDRDLQRLDFGAIDAGPTGLDPDYLVPEFELPPWHRASFLVYGQGRQLTLQDGTVLARRDPPYFNRDVRHFCSHRHAPASHRDGGPAMVAGADGTWCSFPAFAIYAERGQQALRDILLHGLRRELPEPLIQASLPAGGGRVTVTRQEREGREVVHLLYAPTCKRGRGIEVIEDVPPLHEVAVSLRRTRRPSAVRLEPQECDLPFTYEGGRVHCIVPRLECHQLVVVVD